MRLFILFIFVLLTYAQTSAQTQTQAQLVQRQQQLIRTQNNMTYTNIRSYTFVCGQLDDFIIKPTTDHQIKFQIHVYWRQQNIYVTAQHKLGQEIRVLVYQNNQKILLDRQFYITTGFSFSATKGSTYTVRFLTSGQVTKLVSMLNSSPLHVGADVATKQHLDSAQQKLSTIDNQLRALLAISQRNYIMTNQVSNKILANTKIYMGYEIMEVILIIAVAILQVTSLTKLLKGSSIV